MAQAPNDPLPTTEDDLVDERLPLTDLESSSASPPSRRKRAAQIALVALAIIIASTVLWNSIGPGKRQATQPSAPLTKVSALLMSNVTNATITLNGKKLAGQLPMVISAYLETDQITITAPLFRPHTCQYKGLLTKTDTIHCLFTVDSGEVQNGPPYIIGAFLTPDDLLPAQQSQVTTPIMKQLASIQQTTVQPGDYIPTSFTNTAVAIASLPTAAPLQASAAFVEGPSLVSSPTSILGTFSPSCTQLICPLGFDPFHPAPAGQIWHLLLNVVLRWQFTDSTGHIVGDVTYPSNVQVNLQPSLPEVAFVYDNTGWHLAAYTNLKDVMQAVLCDNGEAILMQRLLTTGYNVTNLSQVSPAGCLISVQTDAASGTFLWRFGVLLAADAGAHTLLPDLPIAPPSEIAAAKG